MENDTSQGGKQEKPAMPAFPGMQRIPVDNPTPSEPKPIAPRPEPKPAPAPAEEAKPAEARRTLGADDKIKSAAQELQEKGKDQFQKLASELANEQIAHDAKLTGKNPPPGQAAAPRTDVLHKQFAIKPLRTFQGDAAEIIEHQKETVLSIKMAEDAKKQKEEAQNPEPAASRTASMSTKTVSVALSAILILTGISAILVFKYLSTPKTDDGRPLVYDALMPYDSKEEIGLGDRAEAAALWGKLRSEPAGGSGHIRQVAIRNDSEDASAQEYLEAIESRAPQSLLRALDAEFMAGTFATGQKQNPFLLLKANSFDHAFSGMLSWETDMGRGIGFAFTSESLEASMMREQPAAGTTTPDEESYALVSEPLPFEDLLVQNIDTRALRAKGQVVMIYSFIDRETLLITTNEEAFKGLVGKLRAAKLVR